MLRTPSEYHLAQCWYILIVTSRHIIMSSYHQHRNYASNYNVLLRRSRFDAHAGVADGAAWPWLRSSSPGNVSLSVLLGLLGPGLWASQMVTVTIRNVRPMLYVARTVRPRTGIYRLQDIVCVDDSGMCICAFLERRSLEALRATDTLIVGARCILEMLCAELESVAGRLGLFLYRLRHRLDKPDRLDRLDGLWVRQLRCRSASIAVAVEGETTK